MKKLLLIFIAILLLCGIASATINVSVDEKGIDYIKWSWNSGITLNNLSVDGYRVVLADLQDDSFILSDLNPNETHTIKVYSSSDSGELTTTTNTSSELNIINLLWLYIFIILSVLFIFAGLYESYFSFIGFIVAAMGIILHYHDSSIYMMSIYGILMVLSLLVAFKRE